jgi:hypothetical protein
MNKAAHTAVAGDVVLITGHRVGDAPRTGQIIEIVGEESHELYRVRWEDGHESLFVPGSDAVIKHATGRRAPRKTKS